MFLMTLIAPAYAQTAPVKDFQKLNGSDIRRAFAGHEFGDGVHFNFRYRPNGSLEGMSMGKKVARKWRIAGDTLCATDVSGEICYAVWKKGVDIRLYPGGSNISVDGMLR